MNILERGISFIKGRKNRPVAKSGKRVSKSDREIISKIVDQFKDQSRKDIQKWRQALKMAELTEKPRLNYYHDLIDDLETDGHLFSQTDLRKNSTLNTEFSIRHENGDINDTATNFFRKSWFYNFISEALDTKLRGTKVIEFESFDEDHISFKCVPQRNTLPKLGFVIPDLSKETYINYKHPKHANWVIQIGKDRELGILNNIVPNIIWKRNAMQTWAEFCEKFGLPMVAAYTNRSDTDTMNRIDFMLSQLAQASRGVFPEGSRIEFQEANRTDAYNVFDKFVQRNNMEISEPIVGGTMVTDNGSSRSQSEVHERNLDKKIAKSDKRFITFLVNDKVIPILVNQGYQFLKKTDTIVFSKSHDVTLKEFWEITDGIMNKYEVDEEWLTTTFGIPITGKKKAQSKPNITASYFNGSNIPDYPKSCCNSKLPTAAIGGTFAKTMKGYYEQFLKALWEKRATLPYEARITALESIQFIKGLHKGWGKQRLSVDYNATDHLALQMMEFNIFEFSASKTEARLAAMSNLIIDKDKMKLKSFADFKAAAAETTKKFNEVWLETEYNLSVAVGQTSAQYVRFMSEKDTVTSFVQYQTVGDNKVRGEHQLLDGLVFNLNDKEALDLWSPNGFNCRCEHIQYIGDKSATSGKDAKLLMPPGFTDSQFDINRGDTKQVFTKKQFYSDIKGLDEKLNKMNFSDTYGLDKWSSFKGGLKDIGLDKTITADNVGDLFKVDGRKGKTDFMGYVDHMKRKLIMTKKVFDKHTKGKYVTSTEERHRLFPHIQDVVSKPDEVWLHTHDKLAQKFQVSYLKFFKDRTMVVNTILGNGNMEINTWYNMRDEKRVRKGLLVEKKKV